MVNDKMVNGFMEKKQYTMPLTEVIPFATERLMTTDTISNIAPENPGVILAPKRNPAVF